MNFGDFQRHWLRLVSDDDLLVVLPARVEYVHVFVLGRFHPIKPLLRRYICLGNAHRHNVIDHERLRLLKHILLRVCLRLG